MIDGSQRYAPAARALHWLVAVLVLVVWPLGQLIGFVREDVKLTFYMVHESLGMVILWLTLARLAVRLVKPPPPSPPMPLWERRLADTVHAALYVALIAQPIFGFLATNAFGFPLSWFWIIPIPSPIGEDEALAPILMGVHVVLGWAIVVLFTLHIGGVLKHHLIRRDETLQRML